MTLFTFCFYCRFRDDDSDEKMLPCITFCSLTSFKSEKYFWKESDFLANAYTKEEIFESSYLRELNSSIIIHEIRSDYYGRCYTVQYLQPVKANKQWIVKLNRKTDLQAYLHRCGEETLLASSSIPIEIAIVPIAVEKREDFPYARLAISEKETKYLDRKQSPCRVYDKESFVECCKNAFERFSTAKVKCTTAGLVNVTISKTLTECSSDSDAHETFYIFSFLFQNISKKLAELGCPLPCKQTTYKTNLQYFHANKWVDPNNSIPRPQNHLYLDVLYETLLVEEGIEAYVYDLGSFLAQAGGNLGLCLGFSCLSALLAFLQIIKQKYFLE